MRALAALAGGGLIGSAFLPLGLPLAAVLGVALVLRAAKQVPLAWRFSLGFSAGMAGFAVAVHWLPPTIMHFAQVRPLVALSIFAIIAAYHSLQLGIFAAASRLGSQRGLIADCTVVSSLWVIVEWAFPQMVPWALGDVTAQSIVLRQGADLVGVHGLSFGIVFAGSSLAHAARRPLRLRVLMPGTAAVGVMGTYGLLCLVRSGVEEPGAAGVRVVAIQGGVGRLADRHQQNERAWQIYERMTRIAAEVVPSDHRAATTLTIWPETILEARLRQDPAWLRRVESLVSRTGGALLLGAFDRSPSTTADFKSAFLFLPPGKGRDEQIQIYNKQVLVPFAEMIPGASLLQRLGWQLPPGSLAAGEYRRPMAMPGARLGLSICFEILHAGILNAVVRDGAGLLVNLSDDSWFGGAVEPEQHLNGAVLRAVETRRWLIRASDSGISAIIDPEGRIVGRLSVGAVGTLHASVPSSEAITPYVALGDWVVWACFTFAATGLAREARARRRSRCVVDARAVDADGANDLRIEHGLDPGENRAIHTPQSIHLLRRRHLAQQVAAGGRRIPEELFAKFRVSDQPAENSFNCSLAHQHPPPSNAQRLATTHRQSDGGRERT